MSSLPPIDSSRSPGEQSLTNDNSAGNQSTPANVQPPTAEKETKARPDDLDINQASDKPKKAKIFLGTIILLLILFSLPIATYLVQQRQELRKEAAVSATPTPSPSPTPSPTP